MSVHVVSIFDRGSGWLERIEYTWHFGVNLWCIYHYTHWIESVGGIRIIKGEFGLPAGDEIFKLKFIDFSITRYNFCWLLKKKDKNWDENLSGRCQIKWKLMCMELTCGCFLLKRWKRERVQLMSRLKKSISNKIGTLTRAFLLSSPQLKILFSYKRKEFMKLLKCVKVQECSNNCLVIACHVYICTIHTHTHTHTHIEIIKHLNRIKSVVEEKSGRKESDGWFSRRFWHLWLFGRREKRKKWIWRVTPSASKHIQIFIFSKMGEIVRMIAYQTP